MFVGHVLLWCTMVISVLSGVDYFIRFWSQLMQAPPEDAVEPPE